MQGCTLKALLTVTTLTGIIFGLWILSARSGLVQAATIEKQKICTWLKDLTKPDFARLGVSTRKRLQEIRRLDGVKIACTNRHHALNESPIETSLIIHVDGQAKMVLRYGRTLHFMSPFIPNTYLGFWTY
jgi:hypothetical protein